MSLYKSSSLVMIPTAYKDGKLYSIRPTDGSGDFTFSRGSNLAATRVDVNGLIEKGRENLLLRSNAFDNAYWNKSDSSIVTGQADPNGGSNAFKIVENTNTAYHRIFGNYTMVSGNVYTTSVTAKAAGRNYLTLSNNVSAGTCIFNLIDGSISLQESNVISASTTSLGGGWYRCEMVAVGDKSGTYNVFIGCDDDGLIAPYTGDGTSGVLIYQSQLEAGLVATDYIETGASTAQAGILEDMPRLDYSGSCPALLLEPQRSNALTFSDYLSGSFWFDNDIIRTQNTTEVLSPEGVYNAVKLTETATTARHRLASNIITISTSNYTASVFMKMGTARYGFLNVGGVATIVVDLQEGVITDSTTSGTIVHSDIEDYGNGWYRLSVAHNLTAVTTSYLIQFGTAGSATPTYSNYIPIFLGSTSNNIYAYGAQLEAGSYPTSYIPTYGSSVTRSFDNMNNQAIVGDLSNNYTFFFDAVRLLDGDGTQRWFYVTGTNTNLQVYFISGNSGLGRLRLFFRGTEGTSDSTITSENGPTEGSRYKMAIVRNEDSLKLFIDGSLIGTNTDNVPDELTYYNVFAGNGAQQLNQYAIFPTALTDSECIALTTL